MSANSASSVIDFLSIVERLKRTKRTGWVNSGIKAPESIADHMHRMGIMAMLVDDRTLDQAKCVKMAIVHDLAEALVGDITPFDG
ncbi:HD domain-containing protein 2, partial [Coemansia sp. RSA 2673]